MRCVLALIRPRPWRKGRDGRGNARRKDREANPEAPARRCAEGRRSSVERACDCSGRHGRDGLDRPGWPGDHGGDGAHADPRPALRPERRSQFCTSRRSEEHTSELQSIMRISYAVFRLNKNKLKKITPETSY